MLPKERSRTALIEREWACAALADEGTVSASTVLYSAQQVGTKPWRRTWRKTWRWLDSLDRNILAVGMGTFIASVGALTLGWLLY